MKCKVWIAFLTMILVILIPLHVVADDSKEIVSPKSKEVGGVKLEGKVFDYEQYEAVTYIKDSFNPFSSETLDKALNAIANMFFDLTKMIASLIDTAIEKLYSLSLVDKAADKIGKVSGLVYNNLFESIGILLITVAVIQIFIYYSVGKSGMKAGRATLQLLAVVAVATIWFSNAGYYLKTLNGLSNEVQAVIMKAGTPLADQKIQKGEELNGSLAILRNSYFNLVVKKSYLVMNYGTPDEKEILKDDKKGEHRINDLLKYRVNEEGYKKREEIAKKEVNDLGNLYMAPSTVSTKIGIAVCAFAFSLILGIPLLVLAFLNVGVQILVLAFSTILGVSLLLALLPRFANSGWHNFERMVGLFFVKAFVGIAILFIFVLVQLMEGFIPPTTPDMYMLNIVATAACMFIVFKYRDKIIQVATGGRVSTVDGGMMKQAYEKGVKQPAKKATDLTKKGIGMLAGPVGKMLQKRGQGRNQQGNRQGGNEITSPGRSTQPTREGKSNSRTINGKANQHVDGQPQNEQSTEGAGRTKQNKPEGGNASLEGKENLKKQSSEEEKERTPQPMDSEAETPEGADSTIEGKEHGSPGVSEQDQERTPQPMESEA
ncbi:CD3337/EF1877 family mobilome membrane protein, partial [Bacillus cereus]|uniref:CD3337/EF1877 family mobilome membrane protein n=3 Tax=Bacillus cereus group TaxID=86661 RepID=UPI000279F715